MSYSSLKDFVSALEKNGELHRVKTFVDPVLEIAEVADRITKSGGKALLFENTGTAFPLLINAFGSDKRIAMALGQSDLASAGPEIEEIFNLLTATQTSPGRKLSALPKLFKVAGYMPSRVRGKGACQQVIHMDPDLGILPVLKCWPYDGGRFITLPMVHTYHPETLKPNVGMYRMQVLGKDSAGMHWQRHKTGANHFEAWKKHGGRMPVTVTLGGDPVYTYCATAPLPENISEYILAGFLRKKKVKLVKCITNDIYVPSDVDIVIEGYVDPAGEQVLEGPFGDHTGFYSLADEYPVFHVTSITHSSAALYPATIVGIPPQEDAWLVKATEKIFLTPVRLAIQPEIIDFHMPYAGVGHNLVVVRINKSFPGQGLKVINSLFGAGQMMLTKYLLVVSGDTDIRNYGELMKHILENTNFQDDIIFTRGPLDVLDHSSDSLSFGGKAGIDATIKLPEEKRKVITGPQEPESALSGSYSGWLLVPFIKGFSSALPGNVKGVLILAVNPSEDPDVMVKIVKLLQSVDRSSVFRLVVAVDHTVDPDDLFMAAWQALGNSDPLRDHYMVSSHTILIDGTIKFYRKDGFPRRWPNVVCSDAVTIEKIDGKWDSMGFEGFVTSPSLRTMKLVRKGRDEIVS
jgi:4-hydroxy-3-polyprenylbenzoate decarboxylase